MAKTQQPNITVGQTGERQEIILLNKILEELKKLNKTLTTTP